MEDKHIDKFLRESNAIEDIWDEDSLKQARYAWNFIIGRPILSIQYILKTHKILMLHQPLLPNYRGYLRDTDVMVGGEVKMKFYNVRPYLTNWCEMANKKGLTEDEIKTHHIMFEDIHPFVDGNGRTGRILMNWQRVKNNLPILVLLERNKRKYYDWFNHEKSVRD